MTIRAELRERQPPPPERRHGRLASERHTIVTLIGFQPLPESSTTNVLSRINTRRPR